MIEILAHGPLSTVQDLGRFGYAALGVTRSGAADLRSHRLANRLVGNAEHAATIETTFGGLELRAGTELVVAVTGATAPVLLDGADVGTNAPLAVGGGVRLRIGTPTAGLRCYVAVRGGIDVPAVLGSRSTDLLSGLGPAPLRAGDTVPVGALVAGAPLVDVAPVPALPVEPVLRIRPGPREDWFTPEAVQAMCGAAYEVSPDSNRIGLRLSGPALERGDKRELPSEPVVAGAVQVPPDGQPVLFLADHPVTGGYPVIAVVRRADLDLAAQLRPGQRLRFAAG